jgi:cation:H+ antiporter
MLRSARATPSEAAAEVAIVADAADAAAPGRMPRGRLALAALSLVGLGLLVGGGHLLVEGAVGLAHAFGMSERVIGLTIVAVGTSLPELATSIVAAVRGHSDIAVGNVVGSNIFNVLLILGASSVVGSIDASPSSVALDLGVLGAMTAAAALVIRTRRQVSRPEATVLLLGYVAFLSALALS